LRANGIRLSQLRQADVDQWLLTGPATLRREITDFLGWTAARKLTPPLTLAHAATREGPALGEEDYWRLAHRLLHEPDIATIDRIAGSFVLLYGQQLSRVVAMTRSQVHDRGDCLSIRFGTGDVEIAEPLAGFVRTHLDAPRRHTSIAAPPDNTWLFPGHLPGRPITPARLGQRLARLGIDSQIGRRAAMLQLATTVPAAVLADLLGIHTTTAADWARAAGGDWSHYAAEIARTPEEEGTRDGCPVHRQRQCDHGRSRAEPPAIYARIRTAVAGGRGR
jgi:integrase